MLIVEDEDGNYQPVGLLVSISEAREIATADYKGRINEIDTGATAICPYPYKVWATAIGGEYCVAATIPLSAYSPPRTTPPAARLEIRPFAEFPLE